MRKIQRPSIRIADMRYEWFSSFEDVLDTSIPDSYTYLEYRSIDGPNSHGYTAGLIVGVIVGTFLCAYVLFLLYKRRRPNCQALNRYFPEINFKKIFRWQNLRRRKSYGIKEMISINAPTEFSALQHEQQQLSPVHAYRPNIKSTVVSVTSEVHNIPRRPVHPELPQKDTETLPESSWLQLSPNDSDDQMDIEAGRPQTARTSRVTIPSYYYNYYRKYFDRENYRVQSQNYADSRLSVDLRSYRDRSSRFSIYQRRRVTTQLERTSTLSKTLVPDKSLVDDDTPVKSPTDLDPNLAHFEFGIYLPSKPKSAILPPSPPPPPLTPLPPIPLATRRNRRSSDTYGSLQYSQSRRKKRRQTVSSIATVSTAPIFRQHPGEEVDLGITGRRERIRSSLLNGLIPI